MFESVLDILGWLAVAGGVVLIVRSLLLTTHVRADEHAPTRRPKFGMSDQGKRTLYRGMLLLILGHILKDILPSFVDQLPGA